MRVLLLLCVVEALLLSGCKKKSSPEFYKLESQQSVLISRDGEDAYVSDEMTGVISALQAIPEDALEKPRATELAGKLSAEQARIQAERAAAARPRPPPEQAAPPPPPPPTEPAPANAEEPAAQADQPDAGPAADAEPWTGMDEKTFQQRFSKCFPTGVKTTLPDGKPATRYAFSGSSECQKQYPGKAGLSYLFTEKGLWGTAVETTTVVDAGRVSVPAPPPPPPPPEAPPIITTPGAPQPEGYEKTSP